MSREALKPPTLSDRIAASQTTALCLQSVIAFIARTNVGSRIAPFFETEGNPLLKGFRKRIVEGGRISEIPDE